MRARWIISAILVILPAGSPSACPPSALVGRITRQIEEGSVLAHRSVHRSEDRAAFRFGEGYGREGRQGHPPGHPAEVSAEEKIRIVLEGLRGEDSIAELCRREGIAQNLYYRWSRDFLEAGKKRLAGDTARAATSDEVKDLRREATALKEVVADLTLENRLLKKSVTADRRSSMRYSASEKLEIIRLVEQSHLPVRRTLGQIGIPEWTAAIVGSISIRPAGQRRWTIAVPGLIGCGTVSPMTSARGSSPWP